jgi:NADH-quinone oxidoreductase subunit J
MNIDLIIFIISAFIAVSAAALMISLRNPVLAVMSMILSLVAQAVLYVQLSAMFVGAVLIIVYSGAIMVLFLFVIMLLNLRGSEDMGENSPPIKLIFKYLFSILLFIEIIFIIKSSLFRGEPLIGMLPERATDFGSVEAVATTLFQKYLYPFELTSILLLVAIVGAVIMAKRDSGDSEQKSNEGDVN